MASKRATTFELDEDSKEMFVMVTPLGKFRYNGLPMGIWRTPKNMSSIFDNMADVEVYCDYIGIWSNSKDDGMVTSKEVLRRLNKEVVSLKSMVGGTEAVVSNKTGEDETEMESIREFMEKFPFFTSPPNKDVRELFMMTADKTLSEILDETDPFNEDEMESAAGSDPDTKLLPCIDELN